MRVLLSKSGSKWTWEPSDVKSYVMGIARRNFCISGAHKTAKKCLYAKVDEFKGMEKSRQRQTCEDAEKSEREFTQLLKCELPIQPFIYLINRYNFFQTISNSSHCFAIKSIKYYFKITPFEVIIGYSSFCGS